MSGVVRGQPCFDTADFSFYASTKVKISGNTRIFGIMGDPVTHSLSPWFQNRFLEQAGVDAVYAPFPVGRSDVAVALKGLWAAGVAGLNVTVPHKEAVCAEVHADADAMRIGAVNTLRRVNDGWRGSNTDWRGMGETWRGMGWNVAGGEVLLFGAGGTARAALHALAADGVAGVLVCNRGRARLDTFIAHARRHYPDTGVETVAWTQEAVDAACRRACLVVNTTSIGLKSGDVFPFRLQGERALDVVYASSGVTAFVRAARAAGMTAVDGLPMLVAQGAASFAMWLGLEADALDALRWMERRLNRAPAPLAGWERAA